MITPLIKKSLVRKSPVVNGLLVKGGSSGGWSGKPASWPDIRKNLIPNSIRLLADNRYPLGFTAIVTGGYTVKIDGEVKGTYASGEQCSISQTDWPKGHIESLTAYGATEQNGTPTPTTPVDIVCNNGAIKYSANMANVNAQTVLLGYYISAQGVVTADANNWIYKNFIPVKPNTAYTLSLSSSVYYVSISEYSTTDDSGFIVRKAGSTGSNTQLTITTGATTNFIRFGTNIDCTEVTLEEVLAINWMLNEGNVRPYAPYSENGLYIDGTVETITDSLSNTATAEMLLGVGNIKDTQEILTGAVTRNIGIKVFDGTETFINGQNGWITEDVQDQYWDNANPYVPICSHFVGTSDTPVSGSNTVRVYRTSSQTGRIYFGIDKTIYTSTDVFKQYLAEQYNAGTPVIVVYPLDTATTETVTPQALAGNTATVTAGSISDLQITYTNAESGYLIDYPTGASKAHIIDIYPQTTGNNITAFKHQRVTEGSDYEQQDTLWIHFNITNAINIDSMCSSYPYTFGPSNLTAVTAKNNVIDCGNSLTVASFNISALTYVPTIKNGNISSIAFSGSGIQKVTLDSCSFGDYSNYSFNACHNLKDVKLKNPTFIQNGKFVYTFYQTMLKTFPANWDWTNIVEAQDIWTDYDRENNNGTPTVIDARAGTGLKILGIHNTNTLVGLRVSNQAPFDSSTPPQINVSYTDMDRTALVTLFNDLPTVTGGQIINVTGCTGANDLTAEDKAIVTAKGWTVTL